MPAHKFRFFSTVTLFLPFLFAGAAPALAQDAAASYPNGPINFVVPATPGGTTDVVARLVAKQLAAVWNVPVLVENRAGGGGVIGATHVIGSKPDGRTILIAPSALGVRTGLDRKLPYDAVRELAGVGLMARTPSFLLVSPSLKINSIAELISFAKSKKEGVIYGSAGVGSTGHLHAALFAKNSGIQAIHAPYRGTPEAVTDTITGRLEYVFAPGPNALPFARDGKAKILGTTSAAGLTFVSGVSPNTEVLTGDIGDDWYGAFAPANTPKEIRSKLSREIARILALPEIHRSFATIGAEPAYSTPEELDVMFKEYVLKARQIGDDIGIKLD